MKNTIKLILCIALPLCVGGIGGYATASSVNDWYVTLVKPSFNPPNYLFGPVWTTLYALMGISFYLVTRKNTFSQNPSVWYIYGIQLFFNLLWSFVFFKFHCIGLALLNIAVVWVSIIVMIALFYRVHKTAAYLQIPYLLWVSFASILNASIWYLNSGI